MKRKLQTHILQLEGKELVVKFIDRRPFASLVEFRNPETLTKNESDTVVHWIHDSFDAYGPFLVRMPNGEEQMFLHPEAT